MVLTPPRRPGTRPKSPYEQLIAPYEKRLVWYKFKEKLPEVSSAERPVLSKAPRASTNRSAQTIVAKPQRAAAAKQLIWQPAPRIESQPDLSSPNLLAFELPKLPPAPEQPKPKLFAPPPEELAALRLTPPPLLPDAPEIGPNTTAGQKPIVPDNLEAALASKPKPKQFVPPPDANDEAAKKALPPQPLVPAAPQVEVALSMRAAPPVRDGVATALASKPPPKAFIPPREVKRALAPAPLLPGAPKIDVALRPAKTLPVRDGVAVALASRPSPRPFVAPQWPKRTPGPAPQLAAAPNVPVVAHAGRAPTLRDSIGAALASKPKPRGPVIEDAPALNGPVGNLTAAIIGLKPSARLDVPIPQASRAADFSSGPMAGSKGSEEGAPAARIVVPGLTIQGSSPQVKQASPALMARVMPTSPENLLGAVRSAPKTPGDLASFTASAPPSTRVSDAPDQRFQGRPVYTVVLQMPNVTSSYGSWIVWFSEREPKPGETPQLTPPVPLRKVDPKYVPSAREEHIEGNVQLSGVLRTDGRVDLLKLLRGVDERLDSSAADALLKWEFQPALRNGVPVEVDLVVDIPFRLSPMDSLKSAPR